MLDVSGLLGKAFERLSGPRMYVLLQEFLSVAKEYLQLERRATDLGSAAAEEVRRSLERVSQYLQADKVRSGGREGPRGETH